MTSAELLIDGYGRIHDLTLRALKDVTPEELAFRPDPDANSIAWLVWHLSRVQDSHLAKLLEEDQLWTTGGWTDKFHLDIDVDSTGYGHTSAQVTLLGAIPPELLRDYHRAVHDHSTAFLARLSDADLDRVVDTKWDPPVTVGVRLISVLSDNLQHAGQALFVRGICNRVTA